MPMYNYHCPGCCQDFKLLLKPERASKPQTCATCDTVMVRNPKPPTSMVKETLDNGIMSRRVERLADIEEIGKERSKIKEDRGP